MLGFNRLAIKLIAEGLHDDARDRVGALLRFISRGSILSILIVSLLAGLILHQLLPRWVPGLNQTWVVPALTLWIALLAGHQLLAEMLRGFHEMRFASLVMGQSGGPVLNVVLVAALLIIATTQSADLQSATLATVGSFAVLLPVIIYWLAITAKSHGCSLFASPKSGTEEGTPHDLRLRALLSSCAMLVVGQVLFFAVHHGDLWISGWLLEPADVGILGAARKLVRVATLPSFLVSMTIVSSIPDLFAQRKLTELQRLLRSSATVACVLSLAVFIPLVLVPSYCLRVVFTPQYDRGAMIVVVLALSNFFYTWSGSSLLVLQLTGREKYAAAIQVVAALFLFVVGPIATSAFGLTGLACVSGAALAFVCVASWLAVRYSLRIWAHPTMPSGILSSITGVSV
jgi:O-antigen/teichoic acid export membrane protein